MSLLQGALYLFRTEVKRSLTSVFAIIVIVIFALFLSASTWMGIFDASHPTYGHSDPYFMADYIFVLTFGSIGVIITFIYGGGFKRDVLADRLAYYRSLPISTKQIVLSKILGVLITVAIGLVMFFTAIITGFLLFSDFTLDRLELSHFVHIILLYGLMVAINNIFVWIDLCLTYKTYTILSFVFVFIVLAVSLIYSSATGEKTNLITTAYEFSSTYPVLAVLISIVTIALSSIISYKLTCKSLRKRNLG